MLPVLYSTVIEMLLSCFCRLLEKITAAVKHTKPTNLSELQNVVDRVHGLAGIVAAAEDHCLTLEEVNIKRYFLMLGAIRCAFRPDRLQLPNCL